MPLSGLIVYSFGFQVSGSGFYDKCLIYLQNSPLACPAGQAGERRPVRLLTEVPDRREGEFCALLSYCRLSTVDCRLPTVDYIYSSKFAIRSFKPGKEGNGALGMGSYQKVALHQSSCLSNKACPVFSLCSRLQPIC